METAEYIGKYKIVRRITHSSIASVFEALQPPLNRRVLLKRLNPEHISDPQIRQRFEREAQALAVIKHRNIVHIYDFHSDPDTFYLVEEWVDGGSVADLIHERRSLTERETIALFLDVLQGLDKAHKAGIIHRDIKPGNLLITGNGTVKLTDFGLAQFEGSPGLTQQGMVIGTPAYMAPETVSTGAGSIRSDLYSIGVCMYECLTCTNPFLADNLSETFTRVLSVKPPVLEGISPELNRLLTSLLEKKEEKRPQSTEEVLETVREQAEVHLVTLGWETIHKERGESEKSGERAIPSESGIRPRIRFGKKRGLFLGGIILVIVVAVLLFFWKSWNKVTPSSPEVADTLISTGIAEEIGKEDSTELEQGTSEDTLSNEARSGQTMQPTASLKPGGGIEKEPVQTESIHPAPGEASTEKLYSDNMIKHVAESLTPLKTENESSSGTTIQTPSVNDQKVSQGVGYLMLFVEPWANIFNENDLLAQTPYSSPLKLPSGSITLTLFNPEFPPVRRTFEIPSGDTLVERINLLDYVGVLTFIDAYPWAEVYIDDDFIGRTPIGKRVFLPFGPHKIKFKHPQFPEYVKIIEVDENFEPQSIRINLTEFNQ